MSKWLSGLMHRLAAAGFALRVWCAIGLALLSFGIASPWLDASANRRLARALARLALRMAGLPISATGLERLPFEPHVLLVNHASFLDALVLVALLPPDRGYLYVTRQEFRVQSLLCPFIRHVGVLLLHPAGKHRRGEDVVRMKARLEGGDSLITFPEGRIVRQPGLRRLHHGAFAAAHEAGTCMMTAGLHGTRAALPLGSWWPRRVAMHLQIGHVLQAADVEQARLQARDSLLALCGEPDASEDGIASKDGISTAHASSRTP